MLSDSKLCDQLVKDCREGNISLVVGAGISMSAGMPSWPALVADVWKRTRGQKTPPPWLSGSGMLPHPLALQILLEEIEAALQPTSKKEYDPARVAKEKLASAVRSELYARRLPTAGAASLRRIVEAIRADQMRDARRISRVISFNADDLVEELANEGHDSQLAPVVWPISRASYHPRRGSCANGRSPIPVYHVHGYLPRDRNAAREAPDTLVFTDMQYWDSVASPSSFANRVVGNALHDSHCVFIGLSMHDINLMRWLGNYASEVQRDKLSDFVGRGKTPRAARKASGRALRRHYWIRTEADDRDGLLKEHLYRRGVYSVSVPDWDEGVRVLTTECFLASNSTNHLPDSELV